MPQTKASLRDAATLVMLRDGPGGAEVLMGQRGAGAAFMPSKFVFPGGSVDADDLRAQPAASVSDACLARLALSPRPGADPDLPRGLIAAALREFTEETGLRLRPGCTRLRFMFRAVTPPGRPRRFDARFLVARSDALLGKDEDFSAAGGELSALAWVPLAQARDLPLPFVTQVVLSEISDQLPDIMADRPVPWFHHHDGQSFLDML